jgi:hypothetical protein
MGAHQNPVQGAEILGVAVVSALLNGAFDALIGMIFHKRTLLFLDSALVWHAAK